MSGWAHCILHAKRRGRISFYRILFRLPLLCVAFSFARQSARARKIIESTEVRTVSHAGVHLKSSFCRIKKTTEPAFALRRIQFFFVSLQRSPWAEILFGQLFSGCCPLIQVEKFSAQSVEQKQSFSFITLGVMGTKCSCSPDEKKMNINIKQKEKIKANYLQQR